MILAVNGEHEKKKQHHKIEDQNKHNELSHIE